jgi:hypothetical protein
MSAQTSEFDQRLLDKFSIQELDEMKNNAPDQFNSINYVLDNGYYFVDVPKSKDIKARLAGEVVIADINNFNFLLLNINFLDNDYQYFKVKNFDKLLVVKSNNHIQEELTQ